MTKRFKRIIFILALLGFLIFAPALIFYSQGYRLDFSNGRIVQTGGLFFNVNPNGSRISIDQKISKKTGFIFGSAFISGLLPKNYEIKIEKDGYHPWQKTLEVEEQKVTECKSVQLFPEDPEFSLLRSQITDLFTLPNQKELILKTEDETGWLLQSFNAETKEAIPLAEESGLLEILKARQNSKLLFQSLEFSNDSQKGLLKTTLNSENRYFVIKIDAPREEPILIETQGKIKNISFNPNNSEEIFLIGSNIKKLETEKDESEYYNDGLFTFQSNREPALQQINLSILNQKVISYSLFNGTIFWLNDSGFLYKGQLKEKKVELSEILNLKPLSVQRQSIYKIIINNPAQIFIKEDETLYSLDPDLHILARAFASLKGCQFSPDNKKLALKNEQEIAIIFLEEQTEQPQRKEQEKVRLFGTTERLDNFFWLNNNYLIFKTNDSIKIIEIDDRDRPNLIELTTFPEAKILWLEKQKSLLVLSENNLYISKDVLR